MANIRTGSSTAGLQNVDSDFAATVNLGKTANANTGFAALVVERDAGTVLTRDLAKLKPSAQSRLIVGQDVPLLHITMAATQNTALLTETSATSTIVHSTGRVLLNANASAAANAASQVQTRQSFPLLGEVGLRARAIGEFSLAPIANNTIEIGLGFAASTTAVTDGVGFRYDAASTCKAFVNVNGTETTFVITAANAITPNTRHSWEIAVDDTWAFFFIDDILVAKIAVPVTANKPFLTESAPFYARCFNAASVPASAQTLSIRSMTVWTEDAAGVMLPGPHLLAAMGRHGYQLQEGSAAYGQTANYVNSTNVTGAVPTNTTAALGTGLGGQFGETDTLANSVDGIISSFLNPAAAVGLPGRTLMVTGVTIDSFVSLALTGGGYNAQWSIAFGHTALSLATTESATAKAPRRIALGSNTVASGAAALVQLTTISRTFTTPIPVMPGEYFQTVRKKFGTAPSAGTIVHSITVDAYWL